jgi:hypothetical protein
MSSSRAAFAGGAMRFRIALIASLLAAVGASSGGQLINNPATPVLAKNAGRVVALTEVLRITDEGGAFYFKRPTLLHVRKDGSIFVADQGQLLQFAPDGKFVQNYFKKGQGPGELSFISDFMVADDGLIVHNSYPSKIVRFGWDGKILKDFSVAAIGGSLQFRCAKGADYFFVASPRIDLKEVSGMEAVLEQPQAIVSASEGVEGTKAFGAFPTQIFFKRAQGGGAGWIPLNKIISVPYQDKFLIVSHTPEYTVALVDLEKENVAMTFRRTYIRAKTPPEAKKGIQGGAMIDGKVLTASSPDFLDDIVNLFAHDKDIWVATSTKIGGRGVMIDVFDSRGIYSDCFFLALPEAPDRDIGRPAPQVVMGDSFYAIEKSVDGTYTIRKYRIGGGK